MSQLGWEVTALGFKKIDAEGKRREQRVADSAGLLRDDESVDVGEMKAAQHGEKKQEQGRDAGESQPVEVTHVDAGDGTPAPKRRRGDEEAGDGEEDLYAELAVPDEGRNELGRKTVRVGNPGSEQAHVDVVHQHEEDGQAAEEIDAVEPCPGASRGGDLR